MRATGTCSALPTRVSQVQERQALPDWGQGEGESITYPHGREAPQWTYCGNQWETEARSADLGTRLLGFQSAPPSPLTICAFNLVSLCAPIWKLDLLWLHFHYEVVLRPERSNLIRHLGQSPVHRKTFTCDYYYHFVRRKRTCAWYSRAKGKKKTEKRCWISGPNPGTQNLLPLWLHSLYGARGPNQLLLLRGSLEANWFSTIFHTF